MTYAHAWMTDAMNDKAPNVQRRRKGSTAMIRSLKRRTVSARQGGDGGSLVDAKLSGREEQEEEVLEVLEGWTAGWNATYPPVPPLPLVITCDRALSIPSVTLPVAVGEQELANRLPQFRSAQL